MEILNKLNLASNEIFVGPGTGKVLMPVPANGATETLATISNINTHKFSSGININDKSFITSSISAGELKVLHRNGNSVSNNGFIVRTVDVENSSIHRLELLTTDGYSSYQYNFPLKNGNVVLDSDLTSKADVSSVYSKEDADNKFLQHIPASLANDPKGNIIDESNTAVGKLEYNQSGTLFFKFGNSGSTFLAGDDSGLYAQYKDQLDANTTYRVDFPKKSGVLATIEDLGGINSFFSDALDAQDERIEALEDAPTPTLSNTEGDLTVTTSANIYGFYGTLKMFGITGGNIDIKELSAKNRTDVSSTNASMPVWARILKNVNNTWVVAAQSKTPHKWSEAGASEFVNFEMQPVSGVGISAYEKVAIVFVNAEDAPATSSNGQFSFSVAAGLGGGALVSALASTPTATASSASVTPIFKFKYFQFGDTEETLKLTGGTLTGALKTPTPAAGTNNTTVATTAFVNTALTDYVKAEDIPEVDSTKFLNIDYPGYTQEVAGPVKFYPSRGTPGPDKDRFVSIEKDEEAEASNSPKLVMSSYDGETTRLIEIKPGTNSIFNSVQAYLNGDIPPPGVTIFSAELKLPEKSGTFALTSDIPDVSSYITKDVSNLTNYETKTVAEGKYAQKSDISNVYKYVGSVNTYSALPTSGQKAGDVYNIVNADATNNIAAGDNVAWTGSAWDKLGGSVDLSSYAQKSTTLSGYGITNAYTKTEADNKFLALNDNSMLELSETDAGALEITASNHIYVTFYSDRIDYNTAPLRYDPETPKGTLYYPDLMLQSATIATDLDLENYETKLVAEGKYAQKSTTLAGYGITNAYTKSEVDNLISDIKSENKKLKLLDGTLFNDLIEAGTKTYFFSLNYLAEGSTNYSEDPAYLLDISESLPDVKITKQVTINGLLAEKVVNASISFRDGSHNGGIKNMSSGGLFVTVDKDLTITNDYRVYIKDIKYKYAEGSIGDF